MAFDSFAKNDPTIKDNTIKGVTEKELEKAQQKMQLASNQFKMLKLKAGDTSKVFGKNIGHSAQSANKQEIATAQQKLEDATEEYKVLANAYNHQRSR